MIVVLHHVLHVTECRAVIFGVDAILAQCKFTHGWAKLDSSRGHFGPREAPRSALGLIFRAAG